MICEKCDKKIPEQLDYCPSCKMANKQGFESYAHKQEIEAKSKKVPDPIWLSLKAIPGLIYFLGWMALLFIASMIGNVFDIEILSNYIGILMLISFVGYGALLGIIMRLGIRNRWFVRK